MRSSSVLVYFKALLCTVLKCCIYQRKLISPHHHASAIAYMTVIASLDTTLLTTITITTQYFSLMSAGRQFVVYEGKVKIQRKFKFKNQRKIIIKWKHNNASTAVTEPLKCVAKHEPLPWETRQWDTWMDTWMDS